MEQNSEETRAIEPGAPKTFKEPPLSYEWKLMNLVHSIGFDEDITSHVANGGTLITYAEVKKVRYSDLAKYIRFNKPLKARMDEAMQMREEWEVERCLQELRGIAHVDIRKAYDENGKLLDIQRMPPEVSAAISSIESEELFAGSGDERVNFGTIKRVKFWDKAKAIEMFMKKHGLLVDRKQVEVSTRLEDLVHAVNAEVIEDVPATSGVLAPPALPHEGTPVDKIGRPIPHPGESE